jgi:SAM-dependent methyltransferase
MVNVTEKPQIPKHDPLHREWSAYYQAVQGRPPRETLLFALDRAAEEGSAPGFAVDLGCGDGRDTVEILRRGWRVTAIDGAADALERLSQRPDLDKTQLSTEVQKFETLQLPNPVDLLNASFCLQFCEQECFPAFWQKIVDCIRPGGRFSGQLFGVRDSWTQYSNLNFHTRDCVENSLLANFELEYFEEEEHPGKTALGEEKYWHIFQIVARKKAH